MSIVARVQFFLTLAHRSHLALSHKTNGCQQFWGDKVHVLAWGRNFGSCVFSWLKFWLKFV